MTILAEPSKETAALVLRRAFALFNSFLSVLQCSARTRIVESLGTLGSDFDPCYVLNSISLIETWIYGDFDKELLNIFQKSNMKRAKRMRTHAHSNATVSAGYRPPKIVSSSAPFRPACVYI